MIEDLYFTGQYKDDDLTIDAALVNPADYNYSDEMFVFTLDIRGADIDPGQFTFRITGKGGNQYDAESVVLIDKASHGHAMKLLVAYTFRPEYLYSKVRLRFHYRPNDMTGFIEIFI